MKEEVLCMRGVSAFLRWNIFAKNVWLWLWRKENFGGHDAYLSILLTGGIFMFIAFIAVILLGLYYSFRCIRINQSIGSLLLAYQVFSLLYMIAQTPILFYSSLDCFFLTMITIMIPKYVYNHMLSVKRRTRFESTAN